MKTIKIIAGVAALLFTLSVSAQGRVIYEKPQDKKASVKAKKIETVNVKANTNEIKKSVSTEASNNKPIKAKATVNKNVINNKKETTSSPK